MFNEIMSLALGNGLWAALFCLLFLYQLKDSRAREKKYTQTIGSLTESLGTLKDVKRDCADIKADCKTIVTDCGVIKTETGKTLETVTLLKLKNVKAKKNDGTLSKAKGAAAQKALDKSLGRALERGLNDAAKEKPEGKEAKANLAAENLTAECRSAESRSAEGKKSEIKTAGLAYEF